MRKLSLKILQYLLKVFATFIIKKYRPDIIGITGSIGKTSAKEAIFAVLKSKFNVRKNLKNYNNEIGVPLSIIGCESGNANPIKWLGVFWQALKHLIFIDKNYPQILILEMGADKKGDINYLVKFAKPKISVVTAIAPVHLEFFGNLKGVIEEKKGIVTCLLKDDWLVINYDDEQVKNFINYSKARNLSFGFNQQADLVALEPKISQAGNQWGTNFKLSYKGNIIPIFLPEVLGQPQIYSVLAGAAAGVIYELNLLEISAALKNYEPAKGRLHLIAGIKKTFLIDDTYNSSPKAAAAAVEILSEFPINSNGQRWAVLGDMLELGNYTEEGHQLVGRKVAELKNIDFLVTVGERAKDIKKGAREAGLSDDKIFSFNNVNEVGKFLQEEIREGDLILIKGSQGMRMEKITKEIMAEPAKAKDLLCRQDESWINK